MAQDESEFKSDFKRDLIAQYPEALIWTNSDMFRAGLPDMGASWNKAYYALELKFIKALPKKRGSKCLKHEVTPAQVDFLLKNRANGNFSAVVVGLKDVAVILETIQENYTLEEILAGGRLVREKGHWLVRRFFERVGVRVG